MRQFFSHGVGTPTQLHHHSRLYSTFTHPYIYSRLQPHPLSHAQLAFRNQWSRAFDRVSSVANLEDRANSESDNPQVQAKYLESVLEVDPQYVVRRFESGRYAIDEDVRLVYQRALEMTGQATTSDSHYFSRSIFSSKEQEEKLGSPSNPVHMAITRGRGSVLKNEIWNIVRLVIGLIIASLIFMSLLSSTVFNSVKNSSRQMQTNYHPDLGEKKYTFEDVQGVDEAKEEVQEVVEFLKNPEKFQRLGARLPTGVLLVGPPGTGKTLLAKAIAGEAEVPFFFVSGSEFDEMFVGVGASRVRKLFDTARNHKPCVLFIDELDAIGGKRHSSPMHPYSRMTLNQLLVELDGYKELEGVIIIGATNFPEALDEALIRPGRFDTRITITMPDIRARYKILQLHSKKIILNEKVDLEVVARATTGFTGADLANLINQAALKGCVDDKDSVTTEDIEYAMDKIRMGRERRSAVVNARDRHTVAYHEGGHAIMALFTPGAMPIYKATIIPRGPALGWVAQIPENDTLLLSKKEMLARIDVSMGGRVAEELILGADNVTTGASSDFEQATKLATNMVVRFGMSDLIGPVSHKVEDCGPDVKKKIDDEVRTILQESYERTRSLLLDHAKEHKRLAEALLKYETLTAEEIKLVIANKPLNRKL